MTSSAPIQAPLLLFINAFPAGRRHVQVSRPVTSDREATWRDTSNAIRRKELTVVLEIDNFSVAIT